MKSTHKEKCKQHAFDSFCKKTLKNEARNAYIDFNRTRAKEVSFSELSKSELDQLFTTDTHFETEHSFRVLDYDVVVTNDLVVMLLEQLPKKKRDIMLLSYFLELTDREIGEVLNLIRTTVQYQRTSALKKLRKMIEEGDIDE